MIHISKTLKVALRENVLPYKIQVKILRLNIHNNEKKLSMGFLPVILMGVYRCKW
jgi:hypothetical protein